MRGIKAFAGLSARGHAGPAPRRSPRSRGFVHALLVVCAAGCAVPEVRAPEVGGPAPPFAAVGLDGREVASADLLGTPYILNIWATWCAPCRREMPELQELHNAYSDRGFQVVGVSVDDRGAADQIRSFIDEIGITFPIYHDPSWEIMDSYLLLGLPGSFLIDAEGRIARKWTGPFRPMEEDVQDDVRALLPTVSPTRP